LAVKVNRARLTKTKRRLKMLSTIFSAAAEEGVAKRSNKQAIDDGEQKAKSKKKKEQRLEAPEVKRTTTERRLSPFERPEALLKAPDSDESAQCNYRPNLTEGERDGAATSCKPTSADLSRSLVRV
jgi:hypothetical protein